MALQPKKGTAPARAAAPRTKSSREEMLLSATQALAAEQLPDDHTMTAIEGVEQGTAIAAATLTDGARPRTSRPTNRASAPAAPRQVPRDHAPEPRDQGAPRLETAREPEVDASHVVRETEIDDIRPSPFQPKGRPSTAAVDAVRRAITQAGSLDALVSPEGGTIFVKLGAEAARLAELAYDIATHGVRTPLELRTAEDGALELLAGHRRLAAARLAGRQTVPALHRGKMSSAAAAATVLRGNLHRENFTTWQEAVLVAEVQERRKADSFNDTVRSLGAVMGWSHGKVNMLLRIRRALSPEFLERAGDGNAARAEEALARAPYRDLERLAAEPDEEKRLAATRRMLGLSGAAPASPRARAAFEHRPKRGGGFVIEVHEPIEAMAAGDVATLSQLLETQITRARARMQSLRHA